MIFSLKLLANLLTFVSVFLLTDHSFANQKVPNAHCQENGSCCAELNKFWEERTSPEPGAADIEAVSLTKFPWNDDFACPSAQSVITEALMLLTEIGAHSDAKIDYYNFFVSALKERQYGLSMDNLGFVSGETKHDLAIVVLGVGRQMEFASPVFIAATLVHEGVHVDRESSHVICKHGEAKGRRACDETIDFSLSSDAMTLSFEAAFLRDYLVLRPEGKDKKWAEFALSAIINNKINNPPKYGPDGKTRLKKYYRIEHVMRE